MQTLPFHATKTTATTKSVNNYHQKYDSRSHRLCGLFGNEGVACDFFYSQNNAVNQNQNTRPLTAFYCQCTHHTVHRRLRSSVIKAYVCSCVLADKTDGWMVRCVYTRNVTSRSRALSHPWRAYTQTKNNNTTFFAQ